jgi:hypothetical protein
MTLQGMEEEMVPKIGLIDKSKTNQTKLNQVHTHFRRRFLQQHFTIEVHWKVVSQSLVIKHSRNNLLSVKKIPVPDLHHFTSVPVSKKNIQKRDHLDIKNALWLREISLTNPICYKFCFTQTVLFEFSYS